MKPKTKQQKQTDTDRVAAAAIEQTQADTSVHYRRMLDCGHIVEREQHTGQGDWAVSIIEYSNGEVWVYTNGDPEKIGVDRRSEKRGARDDTK